MIIYNKLWSEMEKKGITTYSLRVNYGFESRTLRKLRENDNIQTKTLDKLCDILDCKLEDIAEFVRDPKAD